MKKLLLLTATHLGFAFAGFAAGIFLLPILTAPAAPSAEKMTSAAQQAEFSGQFRRDLEGSDFLHWGEGKVSVGRQFIALQGSLAPGPDYKLYLSPEFVETEQEVQALKSRMVRVGDVRNFENFVLEVPASIDPANYNTVLIWCESFNEFISAASYQ